MKFNWSGIETVLLDMDGTLLDLHFDNYFWLNYMPAIYAEKNGLSEAQTKALLAPIFQSNEGTLNWYCVDFWSAKLDLDIMQHKAEIAHKIAYRPKAQEFLQLCQLKVRDLRLITNGHREVLELKIKLTELDQYFNDMVCSHELGAPKENAKFWTALQTLKSFDPQTTLFIDDSETVLDAANQYGIKHIYSIAAPDSFKQRTSPSKYPLIEEFSIEI
jgi:HAD superfamily hydrolase (TIGR01509 family)